MLVSSFEFRVSSFEWQVSSFEFQVSSSDGGLYRDMRRYIAIYAIDANSRREIEKYVSFEFRVSSFKWQVSSF